jgi:phytoene dehydrogenase-like protein
MADYDAIVVGAGHNGLTAATVLAKNGLSVLCLEKNNWVGGQASTRELFDGFKHNVGAWALLIFRAEMVKRLELEKYGLELVRPRSSYCVIGAPEDKPFIGYTDTTEMMEHLANDHGPDALEGMANVYNYLMKYKELSDKDIFKAPSSIDKLIAETPDQETREILLQTVYGSVMDVIRKFFPDPEKHRLILGSLCAASIDGTNTGPFTPGSAISMAYHYTLGDAFDFRTPKGGIGALSDSILRALEDHGGKVRLGASVKRFLINNGKITGVELKSGEKITAEIVLSNLDAYATFLGLAGEEHLPSDFVNLVKDIEYRNGYVQIHMTLKEMPEFTGHLAFTNESDIRWVMAYIPSAEYLSRCWEQYRKGQVPDDPVAYCCFPSVRDPSLAPSGYHTCTIFAHYFPYNIPKGKIKELGNVMAERMIDKIAQYAPNFRGAIMDKVVLTQQYFESTFNATAGDFCGGLLQPSQMWDRRPVPGYSDYTTPIKNLFMCGSACHPGPGITCIPGYNGAEAALGKLDK